MPLYEHVFLARPEISRRQAEQLTEDMSNVVVAGGGSVVKTEYWGLRQTAYPVKKQNKAHYTMVCFDAPSAAVQEMERRMRFNADVLRFLTTRVDKVDEAPSAILQNKAREDNRRRRDNDAVDVAVEG